MTNKAKYFFKTKYRIITTAHSFYIVQEKLWWFPFWIESGLVNRHTSIESARLYVENRIKYGNGRVVELYEPFNQKVELRGNNKQ